MLDEKSSLQLQLQNFAIFREHFCCHVIDRRWAVLRFLAKSTIFLLRCVIKNSESIVFLLLKFSIWRITLASKKAFWSWLYPCLALPHLTLRSKNWVERSPNALFSLYFFFIFKYTLLCIQCDIFFIFKNTLFVYTYMLQNCVRLLFSKCAQFFVLRVNHKRDSDIAFLKGVI